MNINLILAIILSIAALYVIYLVKSKTGKFSYSTLTALTLGLILGAIFKSDIKFIEVLGKGYISLIKMIFYGFNLVGPRYIYVASLILSISKICIISLARPNPNPPWGGHPYLKNSK